MSLLTRLFYMLIVLNAPNTNLHCVYFTEHQLTFAVLKILASRLCTLFVSIKYVSNLADCNFKDVNIQMIHTRYVVISDIRFNFSFRWDLCKHSWNGGESFYFKIFLFRPLTDSFMAVLNRIHKLLFGNFLCEFRRIENKIWSCSWKNILE